MGINGSALKFPCTVFPAISSNFFPIASVRVCHHFIMLVVCMSSFSTPWILSGLENWGLSRIFWTYSSYPYILICCYRFLIWGPLSTRLLGFIATGRLLTELMEGTCPVLQYENGMFRAFPFNCRLKGCSVGFSQESVGCIFFDPIWIVDMLFPIRRMLIS